MAACAVVRAVTVGTLDRTGHTDPQRYIGKAPKRTILTSPHRRQKPNLTAQTHTLRSTHLAREHTARTSRRHELIVESIERSQGRALGDAGIVGGVEKISVRAHCAVTRAGLAGYAGGLAGEAGLGV